MGEAFDKGEERRKLSRGGEHVTWPPKVGERIHYNSGWPHTSWSAEVRAVVDEEVAVISKWTPTSGRARYDLLDRVAVRVWANKKDGCLWKGPLPKALSVVPREER